MHKIYVIIVTYNGKKWYDKCFGSLLQSTIPCNIVVVDNDSNDGTVEYIRSTFPQIHVIEEKENLGFAKANNVGIKYALEQNADYVLLQNQDTWVKKNFLEELLQTFSDNKHTGIASGMQFYGDESGLIYPFYIYMPYEFKNDCYKSQVKKYYQTEFMNAAAWLISRECIEKVGLFDTLLFAHFGEDNNYAQRVNYHGFKIMINTESHYCHDIKDRKEKPYTEGVFGHVNASLAEKIQLGDINVDCDAMLRERLKRYQRRVYVWALLMRPSKVKHCKSHIALLRDILKSREENKKPYNAEWNSCLLAKPIKL